MFIGHPLSNWRIGDSTDFKFQKSPLCYTYENEGIPTFALFIRFHSKRKRTIIIKRGDNFYSLRDHRKAIMKYSKQKKKKPPVIDESLASQSNVLQESSESNSKVAKPKKTKRSIINESSASYDEVKDKGNLLENDFCDIAIELYDIVIKK